MTDNEQKKTEPETFEAQLRSWYLFTEREPIPMFSEIMDLCREADQQIADLEHKNALQITLIAQYMQDRDEKERERDQARADLARCVESAPLELVELVEELIKALSGDMTEMDKGYVIEAAQATIERWKV